MSVTGQQIVDHQTAVQRSKAVMQKMTGFLDDISIGANIAVVGLERAQPCACLYVFPSQPDVAASGCVAFYPQGFWGLEDWVLREIVFQYYHFARLKLSRKLRHARRKGEL